MSHSIVNTPPPAVAGLDRDRRSAVRSRLRKARLREWLEFDCGPVRWLIAWVGLACGLALWKVDRRRSLRIVTKIHRSNFSGAVSHITERLLGDRPANGQGKYRRHRLTPEWRRYVAYLKETPSATKRIDDPRKLLGSRILALKSPGPRERGVLVLDYAYAFPLFLKHYDVERILEKYYVVLEPSWTGFCNVDLLAYTQFDAPVFIQAAEPRDALFLERIRSNLVPVPIAANWWVDHRVFRPLPDQPKDADLIMVASWARFKRHGRVFEAMGRLRRGGVVLRTILVGYPSEQTINDVLEQARYFGVADQVEAFEGLTPAEVNRQFNRARVSVLWSRREGSNRAIVEGMFAGVPCIVRCGFNYGHHYEYVNENTGCYSDEGSLGETMVRMCAEHGWFAPREWVMEHMTCRHAAAILNDHIRRVAIDLGEGWTADLVVKHSELGCSRYWDGEDMRRFEPDYRWIAGTMIDRG